MRRATTTVESLQRWAANPPSRGEMYAAAAAYVNGIRAEGAVEALYKGLTPVVHLVAFALSYGSRDRYEDLVQDGFAFLGDWVGRLPKRAVARRVSLARLFLADLQVHLEDQMAMERGGVTVSAAMARFMRQVAAIRRRFAGTWVRGRGDDDRRRTGCRRSIRPHPGQAALGRGSRWSSRGSLAVWRAVCGGSGHPPCVPGKQVLHQHRSKQL